MMNPIDPAKLKVAQRLQPGAVAPAPPAQPARPAAEAAVRSKIATDMRPTAAGAPPVDANRVAAIRQAVEEGSYPLIPTRIADAMIAAGHILRTAE